MSEPPVTGPTPPRPPAPPAQPPEPSVSITPDIRASDSERELIVQRLSENAAAGRLTLAELEERIARAYAATTRAELTPLIADLPAGQPRATSGRLKPTKWVLSVMGGMEKTGRWRVAERLTTVTVMGGNDIDLRHAELDADEVTIVAVAVMGGMDIYVPDTVDVQVGGFAFMGGNGERGSTRRPRPGAPRIRILAYALMGGIDVWRLPEEAKGVSLKQAKRLAKGED
ncbi:MAG TPA: DUF1707 domain-containing protein [Jiangellaceae bacterium]|nr:DUF1707 domain-containing protein [Jiangellaceae bacterium]